MAITPGPWRAVLDLGIVVTDREHPAEITDIANVYGPEDNSEANCRLIAAAPNMLQALEYVRSYGSKGEIEDGPHKNMSVSFFVEGAIKKAKGGSW